MSKPLDPGDVAVTVYRAFGEYVAYRGRYGEEGHPCGLGLSVREAFDNLLICNEGVGFKAEESGS